MIEPIMGANEAGSRARTRPSGGLAAALFPKVRQRVLSVLFGNPGRTFYANEIVALAASGTGAVQRELSRLSAAGLVTTRRQGNQVHYQANAASPVFEELRGLVLKTFGLADVLHAAMSTLAPRIFLAFIYGSVAKAKDTATSDIDLMVVSDSLTYAEVFAALEQASQGLGRPVKPTVYTLREFQRRVKERQPFLTRVLQQPKLWLFGGEHELTA